MAFSPPKTPTACFSHDRPEHAEGAFYAGRGARLRRCWGRSSLVSAGSGVEEVGDAASTPVG